MTASGLTVHNEKLQAAWPRMTPDEQELVVRMHEHYEQQFIGLVQEGEQLEGVAAGIHAAVDELVAQLFAQNPRSASDVPCRRGCSHCCRLFVSITLPEALLLRYAARQAGLTLDRDKLQRQSRHTAADWHRQPVDDQACVFLDAEGSCSVYAHRPDACRKYFVLGQPQRCDPVKFPHGQVLSFVSIKAEIVSSASMSAFATGGMPKMLLGHEPALGA